MGCGWKEWEKGKKNGEGRGRVERKEQERVMGQGAAAGADTFQITHNEQQTTLQNLPQT